MNADLVLDTSGIGQLFGFSAAVPLVDGMHSAVMLAEALVRERQR